MSGTVRLKKTKEQEMEQVSHLEYKNNTNHQRCFFPWNPVSMQGPAIPEIPVPERKNSIIIKEKGGNWKSQGSNQRRQKNPTVPAASRIHGNMPNPVFWKVAKGEPEPDNARAMINITTVAKFHIAKGMAMISTIIPTGYPQENRDSTMDPMKTPSTTNRKGINRFFRS